MSMQVGGLWYDVTLDTRNLVAGSRQVQSELDRAAGSFNVITTAVKVYAAAMALLKMAEFADDLRLLQARVNVASESINAGAAAMDKLREISTRTRSALSDNVQMFTRLNPSLRQMGGNAGDTLRIVELLGKAITVSGATAAEKSSAMLQFAQAMGSGKLAGDEFRAMMESAPYLMKQLADSLGVPIGSLKSLSTQGKLTSDVIVTALGKAADQINRDFAQMPETLASAATVAEDQFKRLSKAADDLTGKNAVLTGITKGAGDVMKALAEQLEQTSANADKLGKNTGVEDWAKRTRTALSYAIDLGDWLNEKGGKIASDYGRALGPLVDRAASAGKRIASAYRNALGLAPDADAPPRAGEQMRDKWEDDEWSGAGAGPGRAKGTSTSKLKAAVDPEEARKLAAKRAAAQAYLDGLLIDRKAGLEKIDAEEQKAVDQNKQHALADKNNAEIYAKAKTAITEKYALERRRLEETYAQDRAATVIAITQDEEARIKLIRDETIRAAQAAYDLGLKSFQDSENAKLVAAIHAADALEALESRRTAARAAQQLVETRDAMERIRLTELEAVRVLDLQKKRKEITPEEYDAGVAKVKRQSTDDTRTVNRGRADVSVSTLQLKAGSGGIEDQVALIRAEAAQRVQATREAQETDLVNAQAYADQRTAIEEDMQRRITETRSTSEQNALSASANAFGALTDALRNENGKQDAIYKAAFLTQKAYAIASSIVAITSGIAKAADLPWPANLAAMASVVSATAGIVSTIKGTNYGGGRQYGGPVAAGSMYRVNETGRPEMYTASNGSQYMMPTASGNVTPADKVGGGGNTTHNHFNITVQGDASENTLRLIQQAQAQFAVRLLNRDD